MSPLAADRLKRLQDRNAAVGIIGLGYVGLPLSILLAHAGFKVTGFDIDQKKIDSLTAGKSYIFRIPSDDIQSIRDKGFTATADFSKLTEQDAIILCVPTPLTEHHEPDLSYVEDTAKMIAPWLQPVSSSCLRAPPIPVPPKRCSSLCSKRATSRTSRFSSPTLPSPTPVSSTSPSRQSAKTLATTTVARHDIPKVVGGHAARSLQN